MATAETADASAGAGRFGASGPGQAALELESVGLAYGGLVALSGVDLSVQAGRITGLIGPNGAGKTSLFDVVTGLTRPSAGRVLLHGRDITRSRPATRARLGLGRTFQRLELFSSLTVLENVAVAAEAADPARLRPRRWRLLESDASAIVDQQLERVGLTASASARVDTLSTGTARLVEVARALAARPTVLLLDEPASGLDPTETDRLGAVLVSLAADGIAVLLVEHDVELVMRISSEVVVLDRGAVLAAGSPAAVHQRREVVEAYLGQLAVS
ncbi:MAG TPA: ABC transporter ATP-binding protein [Acidimicrobiales bacterium]|nr:ABC transporter ATP-binding protein [Acidimicrobiales bacterium]